jgi:FkbM family methyltransferase
MDVFIDGRFEALYRKHPLVLVDVGARGGLRSDWVPAERHLRLIGFEPDQREYEQLVRSAPPDGRVKFFGKALHDRQGPIEIRITKNPALTSIFEPNREFLDDFPDAGRFDVVETRSVDASPLDRLLADEGLDDIDFLKVDTQGSELLVLEGSARALADSAVGVELEVEFVPIYRNQALFADVDRFLRQLGYSLFDLRPCYWKRRAGQDLGGPFGQLVWADVLYLKDIAALKRQIEPLGSDERKSKLLRAMSVALLYGYWDYALEIARRTPEFFDPDDHRTILDAIRQGGLAWRRRSFPGRPLLAKVFRRLWKATNPDAESWSYGGSRLGNHRR